MGTEIIHTIPIPEEGDLGPAMRALPERMRAFVVALMETGSGPGSYGRCARMAGYTGTDSTISASASRLVHDDRIQAAIIEESKRRLTGGLIVAVSSLVAMVDPDSDILLSAKDRLRAIELLLNRAGLPSQSEQKVTVTHQTASDAEMRKRIGTLARELGMDPEKLLGKDVIEGEFVEIEPTGREGLEDLLG